MVPVQDPNAIPSWLRRDPPLPGPLPTMPIPGPSLSDGMPTAPLYTPESGIPAPAPGPGILDLIVGMFGRGQAAAAPTPVAPANPLADSPLGLPQRQSGIEMIQNIPWGKVGEAVINPWGAAAMGASSIAETFGGGAKAAVPGAGPRSTPAFAWPGERPAAGASQAPVTMTVGKPPPSDPLELAKTLIRQKEGFIDVPKWDVNAHRVGYGSDTITDPDGTVRAIKPGDKITREQAEADLNRRLPEFQAKIVSQIGGEAWQKLTPNAQAALSSMAYNYGTLPSGVAAAAKTGDVSKVSAAIAERAGDNDGVNAKRRMDEARIAAGGEVTGQSGTGLPFPGAPSFVAPSLPAPPTIQALRGVDPSLYDTFKTERVIMAPPLSTGERITNVLANMAAGARGAKTAADVLLGAGAGAGRGATENIAQERGELQRGAEKSSALNRFFADVGVRQGEAAVQGANFQTDATNKTASLQHAVATAQAKADADTKNAIEEAKSKLDLAKWNAFIPQVSSTAGGILTTRRNPDGSADITFQKTDDIKADADKYKSIETQYGKGSPMAQAARYNALEKTGNKFSYGWALLDDFVDKGWVANALPQKDFQALQTEAKKGLPQEMIGKPEYNNMLNEKMTALLFEQWKNGKFDEKAWLPFMANKGHVGAMKLLVAKPNG